MKSNCGDTMVLINPPNLVFLYFPRLKSNILLPGSQVSHLSHRTQPVCDISAGGYHNVRTVWVPRAYLIRFSWHLFYCIQISLADGVTALFSELGEKRVSLQILALVLNPLSRKLEELCFLARGTSFLTDQQLGTLYPAIISLALGNIPEWGICLVKMILRCHPSLGFVESKI